MKVGIVTLNGINYGNRLQNFALQYVIQELGIDVETINNPYNKNYNRNIHNIKQWIKLLLLYNKRNIIKANINKEKKFYEFDKNNIRWSSFWLNKDEDIKKLNKFYDYFVCGSDQVWNATDSKFAGNHFAMFAESKKRISYAASFGITDFPNERKDEYGKYLKDMSFISVREESGADIVKKLSNRECDVHIDPTMLLDKEQWESIAKKPMWLLDDTKFVLTYFLGDKSEEVKDTIEKLKENYGLQVIELNNIIDLNAFTSCPSEFIYLISKCEILLTDSFHGSVFSIILNKPQILFERMGSEVSMNTRLEHLLNKMKIANCKFNNMKSIEDAFKYDYSEAYKIIDNEKIKSIEYLKIAFGLKR